MFGRKKQQAQVGERVRAGSRAPTQAWLKLIFSFMEPPAAGGAPAAPGAPAGPPGAVPSPYGGDFVFNIAPASGDSFGSGPGPAPTFNRTVNIPGIGPINPAQFQAAQGRIAAVAADLFPGMGQDHFPAGPEAQQALARLDEVRVRHNLTDQQYQAARDLLQELAGA